MKYFLLILIFLSVKPGFAQNTYLTTIPPFEAILQPIVGNAGTVKSLIPASASPHTYEIRPSDMRRTMNAHALIWGSEHLDPFALKFEHKNRIELLALLPKDSLLTITGRMRAGKPESLGTDPHFWCDPLVVKALVPPLVEKLCVIDSNACSEFRRNSQKFMTELEALNQELTDFLKPVRGKSVMLSHPFFQYFFRRYGIKLADVIEKIPGKEPTPKEIKEFIDRAKAEHVQAIFDHVQLPELAAKLVAESAEIKIVRLDPLGGVPGRENYPDLLRYNARLILEALK